MNSTFGLNRLVLGLICFGGLVNVLRGATTVVQNTPAELTFSASQAYHWRSFPTRVVFTQSERRVELEAFWDGGVEWRVRFAPPTAGAWQYEVQSDDPALHGKTGVLQAAAPRTEAVAANANLRGQIRAVPGAHHFAYADGTPTLLLGDCLLLSGLGLGEFSELLDHRRAAGFNALNVRLCKMGAKNEGGEVYPGGKVDALNPQHFRALDGRLRAAWERGFAIFYMPDFLGFGSYTESEASDLWRYFAARYAAFQTLPILTGEYDNPRRVVKAWKSAERWNALGRHVQEIHRRGHGSPLGAHPYVASSGSAFHGQSWLDYNQIQAKVWDHFDTLPLAVLGDRVRSPHKPTFYAEGTYENQPWAGITGGPLHIRHQIWVALLCGATAVDYGEHRLKSGELKGNALRTLLDLPGASQAALAVCFLRRLDWWEMSPQADAVLVDGSVPPLRERRSRTIRAYSLAKPGKTHVVYLMAGLEGRALTLTGLGENRFKVSWLNPRNGAVLQLPQTAQGDWPLPPRPEPKNEDWVLWLHASEDG